MKKILLLFIGLMLGCSIYLTQDAHARFSGGHSSSSGSHSSSHSSSSSYHGSGLFSSYSGSSSSDSLSDDDFSLGVLITILLILLFIWYIYSTGSETVISQNIEPPFNEYTLVSFKQHDANFSRIVFLDFVRLLYVKYYSYYGKKEFNYLTPYLYDTVKKDKMLDLLIANQVIIISEIVVNSVRLFSINSSDREYKICVEIESNFTIHPAFHTADSGKQHSRYSRMERWTLARDKGLLSLPPEKMQALSCPSCGAPANFTDAGECPSCHNFMAKGQQQWYVKERYVIEQTLLEIGSLVSYAQEKGTSLPTLSSPNLLQEINAFEQQRTVVWSDYWTVFKQQIVSPYFLELNAAWTNRNLQKVRHLISDRLYEANTFWITLYKSQDWTNRLDELAINSIQLVKIELDTYYETITVRVFASCIDYTEDKNKKVIGGSKRKRRAYSEYWTFARRAGVEKTETTVDLNHCPQCGAPADKMGQSAICEYCGSKISTGEFSWVLFLITQDENYRG